MWWECPVGWHVWCIEHNQVTDVLSFDQVCTMCMPSPLPPLLPCPPPPLPSPALPCPPLPSRPSNPMKAADCAFQAKDRSGLARILDQHTDNVEVKNAVESYLDRLPR